MRPKTVDLLIDDENVKKPERMNALQIAYKSQIDKIRSAIDQYDLQKLSNALYEVKSKSGSLEDEFSRSDQKYALRTKEQLHRTIMQGEEVLVKISS